MIEALKIKYSKMSKYQLLCVKRANQTQIKTAQGRLKLIEKELEARHDSREDRD